MVRVKEVDARTAAIICNDFIAAWLIRDAKNILIEAGYPDGAHDIFDGLRQLSLDPGDLDFLALTHIHMDHAGATGHIARANPRLKIFVHSLGVKHLLDPSVLVANVRRAYGADYTAREEMISVPAAEMVAAVGAGDTIDLGETSLEVYETPGHARHHVVYFDRQSRSVFSGDALGSFYPAHPSFVLAPPPDYDPETAKRSIDLVRDLGPVRINFAHCGPRLLEGPAFYDDLKALHDLWVERVLGIVRARPQAGFEEVFARFLERVPDVADYPDQFFSFRLSVKGIITYLKKTGEIEHDGF
jgi:glyoxylase-like metal-dependent hydrolase (beta-lactamase superfamily II)